MKYDFSGWATRANLKCSDGRVIRKDAFADNNGQTVPLVWNHQHSSPDNVLGHALLENKEDGVYAYCSLNDTESGKAAKQIVAHGDVFGLSIYANQLKQQGSDVLHGMIREVSLVLAGANPGAFIDAVLVHGENCEDAAVIGYAENSALAHSEGETKKEQDAAPEPVEPKKAAKPDKGDDGGKEPDDDEETVQDVFDTLTEKQKTVVYALIGQALAQQSEEDSDEDEKTNKTKDDEGGDTSMKHNVFEQNGAASTNNDPNTLSHSEFKAVIDDLKRYGSLKDSFLAHGIESVDYLFPDAKMEGNTPVSIDREMDWVQKVMTAVHHTPFSRIKSLFADLTEDDARAKGYIKGNQKVDEVFNLLKRTTTPTTVYKKQTLDRDDVLDITDFDVVAWLKKEMRQKLDEEIARAILISDGRSSSSADKINEGNLRPIMKDDDLFAIKTSVSIAANATDDAKGKAFIRGMVKAMKDYKGTGEPTAYVTKEMLTILRLMEDGMGRPLYDSDAKIATALRVKEVVAIPVMDGVTGPNGGELLGIAVNLADYDVGMDKGGSVNMFDDFDIDYNQQKYLIETRCSGALTKPFSAIVLESSINSTAPTYTAATPEGSENPSHEGWYEKGGNTYMKTSDTTVRTGKTYYTRSTT